MKGNEMESRPYGVEVECVSPMHANANFRSSVMLGYVPYILSL